MHTRGPRGTCVDGVSSCSCGCGPGFQEKDVDEIRSVKTLTTVVLVRLFEQLRPDASEKPMRAVSVEELVLNVFVGECGDRVLSAPTKLRSVSQA